MALFSRTPKKGSESGYAASPAVPTGIGSSSSSSSALKGGSASHAEEINPRGSAISFFSRLTGGSTPRAVPGKIRATNTPSTSSYSKSQDAALFSGGTDKSRSTSDSMGSGLGDTTVGAGDVVKIPYRAQQFERLLGAEIVDEKELRELSWRGCPTTMRPRAWQLMLGYAPTNKSRRAAALAKKRKEYIDAIPVYFDNSASAVEITSQELGILKQIRKDLPRTSPELLFFHQKQVQAMMERILYIWSIRHPASEYVQGMNDGVHYNFD